VKFWYLIFQPSAINYRNNGYFIVINFYFQGFSEVFSLIEPFLLSDIGVFNLLNDEDEVELTALHFLESLDVPAPKFLLLFMSQFILILSNAHIAYIIFSEPFI
jgi:hypothetical protein